MSREYSFAPLINQESRILILGSLPGMESLRRQQYYAHPRNLFWRILYALFDASPDADYARRCEFILSHRLALWDVCASAERIGSADNTIEGIEPNGIEELLRAYPGIKRIVLNGRKAEQEYRRYFPSLSIPAVYAPSTSPALAALSFEEKLSAWRRAANVPGGADIHDTGFHSFSAALSAYSDFLKSEPFSD